MVQDPRTPLGAHALRALGTPVPLQVEATAGGEPIAVRRLRWRAPRLVCTIQDRWRIDDEWWRDRPISRTYYVVELESGDVLSIYHDQETGEWMEQRGGVSSE